MCRIVKCRIFVYKHVSVCVHVCESARATDTLSKWDYRSCDETHAENSLENKAQEEKIEV